MLEPGSTIDVWVVEKSLGSGGMGSVYRCRNRSASRILAAVKVLESSLRANPDSQARFVREAEILFQLDHPNIVKVRNVRTDIDPAYLEMEFVEGEAVEAMLARGPLPVGLALDVMEQACAAVAYLHAKGIRHRDIKPANLLLQQNGRLKLVDFGLALESDTTRITQEGMGFGTVAYAPPEWVTPDVLDPAKWDVYALGVVFWELLTGALAFPSSGAGSARQQAMQIIVGKQGHPPLDPGASFPAEVRELIAAMTHSDAARRTITAREAWEAIRAVAHPDRAGVADAARLAVALNTAPNLSRATLTLVSPPPRRRWPWVLGGLFAAGLFAGAAVGLVLLSGLFLARDVAPGVRGVEVVVQGVPQDTPLEVRIGGRTGVPVGLSWFFEDVQVGPVDVTWTLGEGCDACPGSCPAWCATGTVSADILAGEGAALVRLPLALPEPREVRLTTDRTAVSASLGGVSAPLVDGAVVVRVPPGPHGLIATTGTCPPDVGDCGTGGTCPEGCQAVARTVEVGLGSEPLVVPLGLPEVVAPAVPVPSVGPEPTVARPRPAEGRLVTAGEYALFIEAVPAWAPGGANAPAAYLQGWSGGRPPPGADGQPVTGVSAFAASNYCSWRGSALAPLDGAPTETPTLEYRRDGTKQVGKDEQGSAIPIDPSKASSFFRFRCAR